MVKADILHACHRPQCGSFGRRGMSTPSAARSKPAIASAAHGRLGRTVGQPWPTPDHYRQPHVARDGDGRPRRPPTSFRASAQTALFGVVASNEHALVKLAIEGRAWDEFNGDNRVTLVSNGSVFNVNDNFAGVFGEVAGGFGVSAEGRPLLRPPECARTSSGTATKRVRSPSAPATSGAAPPPPPPPPPPAPAAASPAALRPLRRRRRRLRPLWPGISWSTALRSVDALTHRKPRARCNRPRPTPTTVTPPASWLSVTPTPPAARPTTCGSPSAAPRPRPMRWSPWVSLRPTLTVDWKGKSDLAVPTPDGVKEPLNRRSSISQPEQRLLAGRAELQADAEQPVLRQRQQGL